MIEVKVYPLDATQPALFARHFDRASDADDYEAFWRKLGNCRLVRR